MILCVKNSYRFHFNCHQYMFICHSQVMTPNIWTDLFGKQQRPRPGRSVKGSQNRVLSAYPSICLFWTHLMCGKTILIKF